MTRCELPLAIDLFCGLGGWTEGLMAEGCYDNDERDALRRGKSSARKAASAHIAKIPYELARHIGKAWLPA